MDGPERILNNSQFKDTIPPTTSSSSEQSSLTRKTAFLFFQNLCTSLTGIKSSFKFKDKYACYSIRQITILCLLKHFKDQPLSHDQLQKYLEIVPLLMNPEVSAGRIEREFEEFCSGEKNVKFKFKKFIELLKADSPETQPFKPGKILKIHHDLLKKQQKLMDFCIETLKSSAGSVKEKIDAFKEELGTAALKKTGRNVMGRNIQSRSKRGRALIKKEKVVWQDQIGINYEKTVQYVSILHKLHTSQRKTLKNCALSLDNLNALSNKSKLLVVRQLIDSISAYQEKFTKSFEHLKELTSLFPSTEPFDAMENGPMDSDFSNFFKLLTGQSLMEPAGNATGLLDSMSLTEKPNGVTRKIFNFSNLVKENKSFALVLELWSTNEVILKQVLTYLDSLKKSISEENEEIPQDLMSWIDEEENKKARRLHKKAKKEACSFEFSSPEEDEIKAMGSNCNAASMSSNETPRLSSVTGMEKEQPLNDFESKLTEICAKKAEPFAIAALASALDQGIEKNSRHNIEKAKSCGTFEKKCLTSAILDARDHLFLSGCGFEIFCKAIKNRHFEDLGTIYTAWVGDVHGLAEQIRRFQHIVVLGKVNRTHHLVQMNADLGEKFSPYLSAMDDGQIWTRYPETSYAVHHQDGRPGLSTLHFAHKFCSRIMKGKKVKISQADIQKLEKLIDFMCETQIQAMIDTANLLCAEPISSESVEDFSSLVKALGSDLKISLRTHLKGKKYFNLRRKESPQPGSIQEVIQESLSDLRKHKSISNKEEKEMSRSYDQAGLILGDIKRHLQNLKGSIALQDAYSDGHLEGWHQRNTLQMQWALEQSYRFAALEKGFSGIRSHDLTSFQRILKTAMPSSKREEAYADVFDLHKTVIYPHYSQRVLAQSSPLVKTFVSTVQEGRTIAQDRDNFLWKTEYQKKKPSNELYANYREALSKGLIVLRSKLGAKEYKTDLPHG